MHKTGRIAETLHRQIFYLDDVNSLLDATGGGRRRRRAPLENAALQLGVKGNRTWRARRVAYSRFLGIPVLVYPVGDAQLRAACNAAWRTAQAALAWAYQLGARA